jgi:hypothetical protein
MKGFNLLYLYLLTLGVCDGSLNIPARPVLRLSVSTVEGGH